MNNNNTFFPTIVVKQVSTKQDHKWDEAVSLFDHKQYQNVVPTILDYLGSHFQAQKSGNSYIIPHGSVVVTITQTATEFKVKCPFINISKAKRVPLMRKLAELRMHPLNLTNLTLENNLVYFSFSCPIELCEPYKIYAVLREICFYADSYDDEFITKFEATNVHEPKITRFSKDVTDKAFGNYQNIITNGLERYNYYMEKRHGNNAWYILNITFKQIEFYAEPQGYLRTTLEKAIDGIFDREIPFHDRLLRGKTDLEKLLNYSQDHFSADLYQIETFIPHKYSSKKENIRENWEESYDEVEEMIANARFEDASIVMQSCYYNLFYYNLVDEDIKKPIIEALEQSSGLDYNQAAPILYKGMKNIMEDIIFDNNYGMDLSKIMNEQMQKSMAAMQEMMANFKIN